VHDILSPKRRNFLTVTVGRCGLLCALSVPCRGEPPVFQPFALMVAITFRASAASSFPRPSLIASRNAPSAF